MTISNWKSGKQLRLSHRLQVSHLFWCHRKVISDETTSHNSGDFDGLIRLGCKMSTALIGTRN